MKDDASIEHFLHFIKLKTNISHEYQLVNITHNEPTNQQLNEKKCLEIICKRNRLIT